MPRLKARIAAALSERWGRGRLEPQCDPIGRGTFGGDLAVKLPQLLREGGPKGFVRDHLPWVVEVLGGEAFRDAVESVQTSGMYVNVTLSDRWLIDSARAVAELGPRFGESDAQAGRTIIVDYSSPNAAKVLHAGHIRSTIIGHVLANLHEACGALVYRVNHVNDFGGFGYTLEGYRRFERLFPEGMGGNERLLEVYRIRRTLERIAEDDDTPFEGIGEDDRALVARYFPGVSDRESLRSAREDFVAASDARFAALGAGDAAEVGLWKSMVEWSLADFDRFYTSLGVQFDLVLGESFYARAGDELVDDCLAAGTAIRYTDVEARADLAELEALRGRGGVTDAELRQRAAAVRKDVGAVVVPLGDGERLVVRRADGLSIYATRDLGAVRLRRELFGPTDITYVVGQEQRVHFSRLFEAARATGAAPGDVRLRHVHFGFYVDAATGIKLSSRDSVANVHQLLAASVEHFRATSAARGVLDPRELDATARQLAVGSVVFNDLKQDVRGPVEIDPAALEATIAGFEESGGAYVVYAACRARSILARSGAGPLADVPAEASKPLDAQEADLLLRIQAIPERLAAAAEQSNPTLLVRHLREAAAAYNSYYARVRVISGGEADPVRLLITKAAEQSLTNGLRACHVACPNNI